MVAARARQENDTHSPQIADAHVFVVSRIMRWWPQLQWGGMGSTVYGPPPSKNTTETTTEVTESEKPTETTLPPSYDPTIEPEVDVYGPPPDSMD